jgi:hypothetical protein
VVLKYLQFFNLEAAISFEGAAGCDCTLYDCQFVDCDNALVQTAPSATVTVLNALFCHLTSVFALDTGVTPTITLQHVTADDCQLFAAGLSGSGSWVGINSLFVGETAFQNSIPTTVQSSATCRFPGPTPSIFQSGGDGSHYLKAETEPIRYHARGTTAIDPTLRAELAHKTTHPPIDLPMQFETRGSITFSRQAERYTDGNNPDLGFYYDAADWTVSGFGLLIGGQVTVLPGTVIALRYDAPVGFDLQPGTSFTSQGTPTRPITYAPVSMIQEGPFPYWFKKGFLTSFVPDYWPGPDSDMSGMNYNPQGDPPPTLNFRFSNFYLSAAISHHFWSGALIPFIEPLDKVIAASMSSAMFLQLRDCALHGGWLNLGEMDPEMPYVKLVQNQGSPIPGSVSFVNNLFDRVNLNLDPDSGSVYWYGPFHDPTIDLRLTATNNTFRGGWLYLEPVRSSAGNWVFENNLFDKTVFAQDRNQPLDYDYNAYWPCVGTWPSPGAELMPDQAAHLDSTTTGDTYMDGAHDRTLTGTAPAYSTGPLGNFYLPVTTPTLQHVGSCSATAIGLYHYTTDASTDPATGQAKEAGATHVDIGLHYVAVETSGSSAGQPKDSDGDGIPDYVENWHGDGQFHNDGSETDWQTATDPTSTVYDDVDLSGNGLVGRVKKALGLTPFDTSNPLTLTQASPTGDEPDVLGFDVPILYNNLSGLGKLELDVDGADAELYVVGLGDSGYSRVKWNTTFSPPGSHVLSLRLNLSGDRAQAPVPQRAIFSGSGPLVSSPANNVLRFDMFYSEYHDQGWLYAELAVPNASYTYTISLYDPSSTTVSPFRTFTGTTSSGVIDVDWDLKVQGGAAYQGTSVRASFEVTPEAGTPETHNQMMFKTPGSAVVPDGQFVAAWACDLAADQPLWEAARRAIQYGVVDPLLLASWVNPAPGPAYPEGFNGASNGGLGGNSGYVPNQTSANSMLSFMSSAEANVRNFYWDGHGSPSDIHGYNSALSITCAQVSLALANVVGGDARAYRREHPFRVVLLNSCDSADNADWAHAFGVFKSIGPAQLARSPTGVQAFAGWDGLYWAPFDKDAWGQFYYTLHFIWWDWMNGMDFYSCLTKAQKKDPLGDHTWNLTHPLGVLLADPANSSVLKFYGYPYIKRTGFNQPHS